VGLAQAAKLLGNPVVCIVDYGLGNLFSVERAFKGIGASVKISSNPTEIMHAAGLVLPGVGAFGDGICQLRDRGLFDAIRRFALTGRPLLGICLGMQLLFTESEEFGLHQGLGLLEGKVKRLQDREPSGRLLKLPRIGWSELLKVDSQDHWDSTILNGLQEGDAVYFIHSYIPFPEAKPTTKALVNYGGYLYCAVSEKDNVVGLQFHPEKSGEVGLSILRNFVSQL